MKNNKTMPTTKARKRFSPFFTFALALSVLHISLCPSVSHAQVHLLEKQQFQYTDNARNVKSDLQKVIPKSNADFYISFGLSLQAEKSFKELNSALFSNSNFLRALSGAASVQRIRNSSTWFIQKNAKKFGLSLSITLKMDQLFLNSQTRDSGKAKAWMLKHFGKAIPISVANNEIVLIQKLHGFNRMFTKGISVTRFQKLNDRFVGVKVETLTIMKGTAHSKLQKLTLWRAKSTMGNSLEKETVQLLRNLPDSW